MSKTDKTKPYMLKQQEALDADPYGTRREAYINWRPGLSACMLAGCYHCNGWRHEATRKTRREGRKQCRDYDLD